MRPIPSALSFVVFSSSQQYGETALIRASLNGHANVVERLLAARANHDHEDKVRNLASRVMLIHVPNAFVPNEVLHLLGRA